MPVDTYRATSKTPQEGDPHDSLLVVDLNNAETMFGLQMEFLKHVKKEKYKDLEENE